MPPALGLVLIYCKLCSLSMPLHNVTVGQTSGNFISTLRVILTRRKTSATGYDVKRYATWISQMMQCKLRAQLTSFHYFKLWWSTSWCYLHTRQIKVFRYRTIQTRAGFSWWEAWGQACFGVHYLGDYKSFKIKKYKTSIVLHLLQWTDKHHTLTKGVEPGPLPP